MIVFNFANIKKSILNAVRRTILQRIPTFAFDKDNIIVHELVSDSLDPDFIKLRLSTLPVQVAPSKSDIESFYSGNVVEGITIDCNVENNISNVYDVTTNDCSNCVYKTPIHICSLKEGEKIRFTAIATVNTALLSTANHLPCGKCFFTDNGCFSISPRVGYDAKDLVIDAIDIIKGSLEKICRREIGIFTEGEITFTNDRYTMTGLLVQYMQDHELVEFAGSLVYRLVGKVGVDDVLRDVVGKILGDLEELRGCIC